MTIRKNLALVFGLILMGSACTDKKPADSSKSQTAQLDESNAEDLDPTWLAKRGESYFRLCASCHGEAGEGRDELEAPAIAGMPAWYVEGQLKKFNQGIRGKHPADNPGMRMYPMAKMLRNAADIKAVSQHVASLTPSKPQASIQGDPVAGKQHYTTCIACHGDRGQGVQALSAPPLIHTQDWYLLTQLHNFRKGVRGGEGDITGASMVPMAMVLANEKALRDVIAYVQTLSGK